MRTGISDDSKRMLRIAVAGLGLVVLILGACAFLQFTKPYAVSEDGVRVQEPWSVKIGDREVFIVAGRQEGQAVIDGIKSQYSTADTNAAKTELSPRITLEKKDLKRADGTLDITDPDTAVAQMITAAQSGNPMVAVTTVDQVTKTETVAFKTEYRISDKLSKGEEKVVTQGQKGGKLITSQVVRVNGEVLSEQVISEKVTREPIAMVVAKGDDSVADDALLTADRETEKESLTAASAVGEEAVPEKKAKSAEEPTTVQDTSKNTQTEPAAASAESTKPSQSAATKPKVQAEKQPTTGSTKPTKAETQKPTKPTTAKATESTSKPDKQTTAPNKETKPPAASSGKGQDVVNYALQFVGNPYVYGGTSLTNGTDCSGFTMSVYAHFGIKLPRTSAEQRYCGRGVSYSQAKPGDLICYDGHVALYIGNGQIVHASTEKTGIKISKATYRTILTVRRIID